MPRRTSWHRLAFIAFFAIVAAVFVVPQAANAASTSLTGTLNKNSNWTNYNVVRTGTGRTIDFYPSNLINPCAEGNFACLTLRLLNSDGTDTGAENWFACTGCDIQLFPNAALEAGWRFRMSAKGWGGGSDVTWGGTLYY